LVLGISGAVKDEESEQSNQVDCASVASKTEMQMRPFRKLAKVAEPNGAECEERWRVGIFWLEILLAAQTSYKT